MSKLTLTVANCVVSRAGRYAKQHRVSVSELVEAYLDAITGAFSPAAFDAPILRSVRGALKKGQLADYRKRLTAVSMKAILLQIFRVQ